MSFKVTAQEVNKLRQSTGAGMMDCKKALVEAEGDMDKAMEVLRLRGQKLSDKRSDRDTNEGVVVAHTLPNQTRGVLISLNCETDFVARNEDYISFAEKIADIAVNNFPETVEELLGLPFDGGLTIKDKITEQTGVIGEKLELANYEKMSGAQVVPYNHSNRKLGVILSVNKRENAYEDAARNLAMQVAALGPVGVDENDVSQEVKDKEYEIGKEMARQEGKPEQILDKIATGRLNKYYQEHTLLNQKYVKNSSETVRQYLQGLNKDLTVTGFRRVGI